jgi:hypothetical protein
MKTNNMSQQGDEKLLLYLKFDFSSQKDKMTVKTNWIPDKIYQLI